MVVYPARPPCRFALRAALLTCALCPLVACSPTRDDGVRTLLQGIIRGTPDTNPAHQAVVVIEINTPQGAGMCSGTLIASKVVLTAAHCIESASASNYAVGFGNDANTAGMQWVGVSSVKAHPAYDPQRLTNDIACIRVTQVPFGLNPIPNLPAALGITRSDVGTMMEFVGFGETETGSTGKKLHVSDSVSTVCEASGYCYGNASLAGPPNSICFDQQPGGPCSGDSGGPAFVLRNGIEYVGGVTSYGDQNCAQFGCSTKVDGFEAFINQFVTGTAPLPLGSTCSVGTQCASNNCADGVCCNTACNYGACDVCASRLGAKVNGTCELTTAACDDGNKCTTADTCRAGYCTGVPILCPQGDACHSPGACSAATGQCSASVAKPNGAGCDDGNGCTANDTCQQGVCKGSAATTCPAPDSCHEASTCTNGACGAFLMKGDGTACDDKDPCSQSDVCVQGVCKGTRKICPAADACHEPSTCNPTTGACGTGSPKVNGARCDDGNGCTTNDVCSNGVCRGTPGAATCPGDACHNPGVCDQATGKCVAPVKIDGTPCDDKNACTRTDACQGGACVGANPVVCVATDGCHESAGCDWQTGQCLFKTQPNNSTCDDGNGCTEGDICLGGKCQGTTRACPAPDECHAGSCDKASGGCTTAAAPDGTACSGGTCTNGVCGGGAQGVEAGGGCGCAAGSSAAPVPFLLSLVVAAMSRRRRQGRATATS